MYCATIASDSPDREAPGDRERGEDTERERETDLLAHFPGEGGSAQQVVAGAHDHVVELHAVLQHRLVGCLDQHVHPLQGMTLAVHAKVGGRQDLEFFKVAQQYRELGVAHEVAHLRAQAPIQSAVS